MGGNRLRGLKAFLLAAGRGRRLSPLTDELPKCLVPIRGEPLLNIWLNLCERHNISEVLINLHHLPEAVYDFLARYSGKVVVHTVYEQQLLGSGGTIMANRSFVEGEQAFFILYADNLTNADLSRMQEFHLTHDGVLTIGLFRASRPEACGIVDLDEQGTVTGFEEKPLIPRSNLASAGILIANPFIYDFIPRHPFVDLGTHVLPGLVGRMYGYEIREYLLDIGTSEQYERAQQEWSALETMGQW